MPRMMAAGVLMIAMFGRCSIVRKVLITPFFSRSVCHAMVLKRKFIHIGRMKMNTTKLPFPIWRFLKISANGYARRRQITVLTPASARESQRAFRCSEEPMARMFARVNAPLRSVNP